MVQIAPRRPRAIAREILRLGGDVATSNWLDPCSVGCTRERSTWRRVIRRIRCLVGYCTRDGDVAARDSPGLVFRVLLAEFIMF